MRKKTIIYDPNHYDKTGIMAGTVYGTPHKIKKQKVITRNGKVTKIVDYGPVNYYGKQTKTKRKF